MKFFFSKQYTKSEYAYQVLVQSINYHFIFHFYFYDLIHIKLNYKVSLTSQFICLYYLKCDSFTVSINHYYLRLIYSK
jgi:hypothetical protein